VPIDYRCTSTAGGNPVQSQTLAAGASGKYDIKLTVTDVFSFPDWFRGVSDVFVSNPATGPYDYNIEFYYEECCRLSALRNSNNDRWFRVQGMISRNERYGLKVEGAPRIRFRRNQLNTYFLYGLHQEGHKLEYFWTGEDKSRLNTQKPNAGTTMTLSSNDNPDVTPGVVTWTPSTDGLYAAAFMIVDTGVTPPPPGAPAPVAIVEEMRSFTPLDFIFEVSNEIGPYFTHPFHEYDLVNGYDNPLNRVVDFYVNIENTYPICSRDDRRQTAPHMNGANYVEDNPNTMVRGRAASELSTKNIEIITPSGVIGGCPSCFRAKPGFNNKASNPMCFLQSWSPKYGDTDRVATYISYTTDGIQSLGLYQVTLRVVTDIIYVSGIIRDFHDEGTGHNMKHPDFAYRVTANTNANGLDRASVNANNNGETSVGLVQRQLGANGKPVLRTTNSASMQSTSAKTVARIWERMPEPKPALAANGLETCNLGDDCVNKGGFYDWFVTDEVGIENGQPDNKLVNKQRVFSVALSRQSIDRAVFTFDTNFFYPIDNQLLGNEGDPHNFFFTWEIKTFLTYSANDQLEYESVDDMWVYIDGQIPVGWTLGGIPPYSASGASPSHTVNLGALGLSLGSTYRVDMYYAHRSDRNPGIKIELPDFSLCDGLSDGRKVVQIPAFTSQSKDTLAFGGDLKDDNFFQANVGIPGFVDTYDTLHLLRKTDSKASAWYHDPTTSTGAGSVRNPTPVKLLNGFEAKFDFFVKCDPPAGMPADAPCAEGFAFVLHRNDNAFLGGGGGSSGLGYAGSQRVFATEFDMLKTGDGVDNQDYGFNPASYWSEVSYHTRYKSADGTFPSVQKNEDALNSLGANTNIENGEPIMDFSNGTYHRVTVRYLTGQKDKNGEQQPGYFRTYINDNLAPIAEAQIEPPNRLDELLGGAAYVGFTASNSATYKADIYISNWELTLITTSAANTAVISREDLIAGNTGCAIVQARDACNNDIQVGGEASKFRAFYKRLNCPTPDTTDLTWDDPQLGQFGATQLPPDQFGFQPIDNFDGTYTFCYDPTKTGQYLLEITFQEVEDGPRETIWINQQTGAPNEISFNVNSAVISASDSKFRLPLSLPWEYYMGDAGSGLYIRGFTGHGTPLSDPEALATDVAGINAYLGAGRADVQSGRDRSGPNRRVWENPADDIVAFAKKGSFSGDLSSLNLPAACFTGGSDSVLDAGKSWVCIVRVTGTNPYTWAHLASSYTEGETPRDANGDFTAFYRGDDRRTTFVRSFMIAGESATTECDGHARIGAFHQDKETPFFYRVSSSTSATKVPVSFSIESVDAFGNLDSSASSNWEVFFPDYPLRDVAYTCGDGTCDFLESCILCPDDCFGQECDDTESNGYYTKYFTGNRAARYAMYVSLNGGQLGNSDISRAEFAYGAESPYAIVLEPGPACLATSSMLGSGINPTAGVEVARIEVKLADCEGNPITRDRDIDDITGVLAVIPNKDDACDANAVNNADNCDPQEVSFEWTNCNSENVCQLFATYTPIGSTIGGGQREWSIDLTINGETGSKGLPSIRPNFWDPATSGPVSEGLQDTAYCVSSDPQEAQDYGKLLPAGVEVRCLIQSRDSFNNARVDQNSAPPQEVPTPASFDYDVAVVCNGGTCVENGAAEMIYANGNGQYYLIFTPQKASTAAKQLVITITGQGEQVVELFYTVLPGDPAPESILARSATTNVLENAYAEVRLTTVTVDASEPGSASCENNDCEFVIVSLDRFGNMRKPLFNGAPAVAEADDYEVNLVTFFDPPQLGEITIEPIVDGIFTYRFSQSSPTAFYKIVANTNQGASITDSPWGLDTNPAGGDETIRVDPGDPFGPQFTYNGQGLVGCITGSQGTFSITPSDFWGNFMIDFDDLATFTVQVVDSNGVVTDGTVRANPLQDLSHLGTDQRYSVRLSYEVEYSCPSAGDFEIYLSIDNEVTNSAVCRDWIGLTGCNTGTRACGDTQTFGDCGHFKVFSLEAVANADLSYAKLVAYQFDPTAIDGAPANLKSLLSVGRPTHPNNQEGAVDWWYIQDQDAAGNNIATPGTGSFRVVLVSTDLVDIITISDSDILPANSNGKWWVKFTPPRAGTYTAKIYYKGIFQTQDSGGNPWESEELEITIGEVYPRNSNVEWVQDTINAGSEGSFLVQLVDVENNVHPGTAAAPYCPRLWDTTPGAPIDQTTTTVNCDEVRADFSLQNQIPSSVDCESTDNDRWICRYTLETAGSYNVKVFSQVDDQDQNEIDSSTGFSLTVIAGPPSAATSYLSPTSASASYVAGVSSVAELVLLDDYLNPAVVPPDFGSSFGIQWQSGTGEGLWSSSESSAVAGTVAQLLLTHKEIDATTRIYDPQANPPSWQDGSNNVLMSFDGTPVTGAPNGGSSSTGGVYTLTVKPGAPCSGQAALNTGTCKAGKVSSIVCASNSVAGEDLELTLTVYDVEGNGWDGNQPFFSLDQLEPTSFNSAPSLTPSTTNPGQYSLALGGSRTQNVNVKEGDRIIDLSYVFSIALDGQTQVDNVDTPCTIVPAATDVDMSGVFFDGDSGISTVFDSVLPDVVIDYVIIPRDSFGNYKTEESTEVWTMGFDIDGLTGGAVRCPEDTGAAENSEPSDVWSQESAPTWDDSIKGFRYSMKTSVAGTYSVSMKLRLGANPEETAACGTRKNWIQIVCADQPDPGRSYFSLTAKDGNSISLNPDTSDIEYVAGTIMLVETTLQDRFGNPVVSRPGCQAGTASVRVDNGGDPTVLNAPLCPGGGVDCYVTQVDVEPPCRDLFKREECAYPQSIKRETTNSDGRTLFEVNVTEAREFFLVPSIESGGSWQALSLSEDSPFSAVWDSSFLTVPAQASRFTIRDKDEAPIPLDGFIGTAAVPSTFLLFAADMWENLVSDSAGFTYRVRFDSSLVDYGFDLPSDAFENYYSKGGVESTTCFAAGDCDSVGTRATFKSSWHGLFSISVSIRPQGSSESTWSETLNRDIYHATCNFENPDNNYRCADKPAERYDSTCVAEYADCLDLDGEDVNQLAVSRCEDGSYNADPTQCNCPGGSTPQNGVCAATSSPIILAPCPAGHVRCTGAFSNQCRASADECPNVRVCPPGWVICGDRVTCARRTQGEGIPDCPAPLSCPNGVPCWDGHCRSTPEDCPTPPTCAESTDVVCGDGSCAASRDLCPDRYNCFGLFTCPDGSCRSDLSGCPSKVTCPVGQVMCESGACMPRLSDCPAAQECTLDQVRCPDGSCKNNLLFCSGQITCSPSVPVLCPDGSCVKSVSNCGPPPVCPDKRCSDGYCVTDLANCPSSKSCPELTPVLCQDGSCVDDIVKCEVQPRCPPEAPVRCPDNACTTDILLCPTKTICDSSKPVKCPDNQCSVALEACGPAPVCSESTPYKCPGGECAVVRELCPTHITCPYDTAPVRCLDGTCRKTLDECPNSAVSVCDAGKISCPQAGVGVPVCATTLANCPTNMICPPDKRVRCIDNACAASTADCPAIPDYPSPDSYVPCADGSWVTPSVSCPRPVTCSLDSPIKCWDGSCRVAAGDCPSPETCSGGFLCPNGACGLVPWALECSPSRPPCADPEAVYCENGNCVTDVSDCDNKYENPDDSTLYCPLGHNIFCRDGTCRAREGDCEEATCVGELPYLCEDGSCRQEASDCLQDDGCPQGWSRCPSGRCSELKNTCEPEFCPGDPNYQVAEDCNEELLRGTGLDCDSLSEFNIQCDEGSCASSAEKCPDFKGCFDPTSPFRCADGTCVATSADCIKGSSTANTCPSSAPVRCSDGLCAVSITYCVTPSYDAGCTEPKPIQCADGSCADLNGACPLVKPCKEGEMRCGDGSCRDVAYTGTLCPTYDSCPENTRRCFNGLCSPLDVAGNPIACDINPITGCLEGQVRCNSGLCAADLATCDAIDATFPDSSGCPSGKVKCSEDGSCQDDENQCVLGNGCLSNQIKCPEDGSCVGATDYNNDPSICGDCSGKPVICPDGSCQADLTACKSNNNGCPLQEPYRCADGTCAVFAAGTVGAPVGTSCPTSVVCNPGNVLCADGSCAITKDYCPSAPQCPEGEELCTRNWKCVPTGDCTEDKVESICPPANPIRCASGECREAIEQCTGGDFGGGKPLTQCDGISCFDGGCYDTAAECLAKLNGLSNDGELDINAGLESQLCKVEGIDIVCSDGRCVNDASSCGIIPRCAAGTMRCMDGSCGSEESCKSINDEMGACEKGTFRCEDGFCRKTCLSYDGCGLRPIPGIEKKATPYQCPDRECATSASACADVSVSRRRSLARRHLAQLETPMACQSNCYAQVKASIMDISLSNRTKTKSSFTIARGSLGEALMTLEIPSGAVTFINNVDSSTLKIRPVGEDSMRMGINPIARSRRNDPVFQYPDVMNFVQSVISPAFECSVTSEIKQPFATNFTVISTIDATRYVPQGATPVPQDYNWIQDVCMAKLVKVNGYAFWSCLWGQTELRRLWCEKGFVQCKVGVYTSGLVWNPEADEEGQPTALPPLEGQTWKAASSFNRCLQNEGVEAGSAPIGITYAFITNPLREYVAPGTGETEPNETYVLQVTFGILGLLTVLGLSVYCLFRFSRYRKKYKKERAEADRLHEEMDNMEQFGTEAAGLKSGDVVMSKNPLAQQISHLSAAVDESEMKLQQAEQQLKVDEAGVRANHLENMKENRNKMLEDLNKLKAQLAAVQDQARGGATVDDNQSTGYADGGDQWASGGDGYDDPYGDSDPYGGSDFTAAAPKRQNY
jgi:fibro-slime domain-containing protein